MSILEPDGDREIEHLAKRSISRQIVEAESRRESLRHGLEAVAVRAIDDMDDLMAACRQAFVEAKADSAGLMTPATGIMEGTRSSQAIRTRQSTTRRIRKE